MVDTGTGTLYIVGSFKRMTTDPDFKVYATPAPRVTCFRWLARNDCRRSDFQWHEQTSNARKREHIIKYTVERQLPELIGTCLHKWFYV